MHPHLNIRSVHQNDSPALAQFLLDLQFFSALQGVTLAEAENRVTQNIAACLADNSHSVYVAVSDRTIVGYVAVHWLPCLYMPGPEGFISELFVGEGTRRQGVGAQLLDTVIAEARQRGCARLELINMKHRDSYLRGFYSKHGWEERPIAANFVYVL
jgi:GNAT superfamily N-acetyltransferase